jgi:hypothetical protein
MLQSWYSQELIKLWMPMPQPVFDSALSKYIRCTTVC